MATGNHFVNILKAALPQLKAKYPIAKIAIFGSAVRDDFDSEKSDIDVMVELHKVDFHLYIQLAEELESLFGKKVDLITRDSLKSRHWEYLKDKMVYA